MVEATGTRRSPTFPQELSTGRWPWCRAWQRDWSVLTGRRVVPSDAECQFDVECRSGGNRRIGPTVKPFELLQPIEDLIRY